MRLIDADELIKCIPSEEYNSRFAVMNAPTIEPQNWISCDERLPKYGKPVLTYNLKDDEYEVNHIIDEEDGKWFIYGADAWMSTPEPYNKED